jgi:two-component system nitrate/nitrite response regulator NarL
MTTLMIADDHPIILSGVEALLRNTPYEVIAKLKSGNEVLAALEEARPDILVLDVNMPDGSGIDVLRTLRQREDRLPVILLTAGIDERGVLGGSINRFCSARSTGC